MQIATWTAVVGSIVPLLAFLYLVVFGQRSLPEWLRERQYGSHAFDFPEPEESSRGRIQAHQPLNGDASASFSDFRQAWLEASGRFISDCWSEFPEGDFFPALAGLALRFFLFFACLLVLGPLVWLGGAIFNHHTVAKIGIFTPLGGIASIGAEIYLMILLSLVTLVLAWVGEDV